MNKITLLVILFSLPCFAQLEEKLVLLYKFHGHAIDETENHFKGLFNNVVYVEVVANSETKAF